ncbi:MAG: ABC-F family ATP-binding cassette domain-containing protein, partial [Bacteroidales bacterium]|nr:ABC-F family ATP-binding cassette domain-containing protein [Bacteroidales bacterium]
SIYTYRGDYENYLEKRAERIDNYNAETEKVRNILRRELEWVRSTPCARTGKAKYRKEAFYDLKDRAEEVYRTTQVSLSDISRGSRLGSKVINCKDVSFYYGGKCYLSHFTYNFQRYDRVGIVGRNGCGKTTFINLLTGNMFPDDPGILTGEIDRGESLNIGYYHQSGIEFDEDQTVLETVNDTHLLGQFLFPHDMLSTRVAKLSGGEKRRLYLLTILIKKPNLLILDEPTNDLDIVTLNVLEEYLREYKGSLIIVSHDRHFMDRLVDHLLVFTGDGEVKDFIGKYSEYREFMKKREAQKKAEQKAAKEKEQKKQEPAELKPQKEKPRKLSFKERKEMETLEKELEDLAKEKETLSEKISSGSLAYSDLQAASSRYAEVSDLIDVKEMRWLELSELA